MLLPAAAITHLSLFGLSGFSSDQVFGLLIGASVAPVIFHLGSRLHFTLSVDQHPYRSLHILFAGMVAAVVNALLTNLAYGSPLISYFAYATGDFFGQMLCFYLMLIILKRFKPARG